MTEQNHIRLKRGAFATLFLLLVFLLVHLYTLFNVSPRRMVRGVALIEDECEVVVELGDSNFCAIANPMRTYTTGFFTSRSARLTTRWQQPEAEFMALSSDSLHGLLQERYDSLTGRCADLEKLLDEMDYYAQTHTVIDEGYNQVMALETGIRHEHDSIALLVKDLEEALKLQQPKATTRHKLTVFYQPSVRDTLRVFKATRLDSTRCQLDCESLPEGAYVYNPTSLRWWNGHRWAVGFIRSPSSEDDSVAYLPKLVVLDDVAMDTPFPNAMSGAPVVDAKAHLRGVCTPDGWTEKGGFRFAPRRWWQSVCQWIGSWFDDLADTAIMPRRLHYEQLRIDSLVFVGATGLDADFLDECGENDSLVRGDTTQFGRLTYPDGSYYIGELSKDFKRNGYGFYVDTIGARFVGRWEADTLPKGARYYQYDRYEGDFDSTLLYSGEGVLYSTSYYDGEWKEGKRSGNGIGLIPGKITCVGMWRGDVFQGENIIYNANRVYGIDISRYQHEKKRRKYPIHWKALRIIHLGTHSAKKIQGRADYPVSFCYIKASQGVKTKSRYSTDDAIQARRAGVRVGHYHFFAPSDGVAQANWFLRNANLRSGDMPPMLDVELYDSQIRQMGGTAAMMRQMCRWIAVIKAHCHTTPVLYVNQRFVDKYMEHAPSEVLACPVWIARYGQYRPYVRLTFWQLSADGGVRGITPEVDIDVFNGSREQFQEFYHKYRIK